jgi:hypothetical protein
MGFARSAVSAVDQDRSSNGKRCVCDHGHLSQPRKRNSQLEAARLQNSARRYHDWRQYIRADWYVLNSTFRVHIARGRVSVLTAASEKFGMKLA